MSVRGKQAPQMMGAATRLHRNHSRRKLGDIVDQRLAPHRPSHDHRAGRINAHQAANILAQINSKYHNRHRSVPFSFKVPSSYPMPGKRGGPFHKGGFAAELAKVRRALPKGTPIEIWFQDEARIGQKNKITRRWARRGTWPSAPKDQRAKSAYIFGAICPEHGKGAGLVLPFCNTQTMTLHLAEIALAIAPGAHAVVLMDQAGWHMTDKLDVPGNISIIALPAKCPELNPVENIWQFMRDNWLSNRVFTSHDNIVDHCCEAWNKLVDQPWRIMTIGHRKWVHGS